MLNSLHDENETGSMIIVRPVAQMGWRVHQMLHPVHGNGPFFTCQRQYPLDPQNSFAMPVEQHGQPDAEGRPVERLVDDDREGADTPMLRCPHGGFVDRPEPAAAASLQKNGWVEGCFGCG